jgi:hypothetical protein
MAISGPNVQMPSALTQLVVLSGEGKPTAVTVEWASFFRALQQAAFSASRSGPTASRPTSALSGRYIGMPYFDTTLGLTAFLKSVNPDVWVNGAGGVV